MTDLPEPIDVSDEVRKLRRHRAPEDLWDRIVSELNRPASVSPTPLFRRRVSSPWLAAAAVILALIGGTYVGLYRLFHSPSNWVVTRVAGAPNVGGESLTDRGRIETGSWLVTDSASRAQLEVGRIGFAEVGPTSRVRLDPGKGFEHRLTLERGSLDAVITAPPRLFFVETPSALATDLGCAYTLSVDEDGNTHIHVTAGWVELEQNDRISIVPAGLVAEVQAGTGPGTPHPGWLSDSARSAVQRLDRGTGSTADLELVLSELATDMPAVTLRKERAITIWHLLQRVDGNARTLAYDHLARLSPSPEGVTREGTLALERPMLERWRRDLNPLWSEEDRPFFVRLARRLWDLTVR